MDTESAQPSRLATLVGDVSPLNKGLEKPTFNDVPYPPQARGYYEQGDKTFVSVHSHDGNQQWVEAGATLDTGWKVEGVDKETNQVKFSAKGVPVNVKVGLGVPTGKIDEPYKIVSSESYKPEFQNFTKEKHDNFQNEFAGSVEQKKSNEFQGMFNAQSMQKIDSMKAYASSGAMSEADSNLDQSVVQTGDDQDLETDDNNPAYKYHPDVIEAMKQNYEASGGDPTNIVSLEQFREMQMNGTAKEGIDYLVPMTVKGVTDFQLYRHKNLPTK